MLTFCAPLGASLSSPVCGVIWYVCLVFEFFCCISCLGIWLSSLNCSEMSWLFLFVVVEVCCVFVCAARHAIVICDYCGLNGCSLVDVW